MTFLGGVVGRVKPLVSSVLACAVLSCITRAMDGAYPAPWTGYHAEAKVQVVPLRNELTKSAQPAIFVLSGAVAFVLLIVCANVASMFLARAEGRRSEIATRAAIGASKSQIIRLLLMESLVLGAAGGAGALLLARISVSALEFLLPAPIPHSVSMDWRVLAFTALCSLTAAILFGLAPAFLATKVALHESLKARRATGRLAALPFPAALSALQIALSVVLVAGALLLARCF